MKIEFDERFAKDIRGFQDRQLLQRIEAVITEAEKAKMPQQIRNLKRLQTSGNYYRIRVGDYRIGLMMERGTITFVRCLHRKEVYRYFP